MADITFIMYDPRTITPAYDPHDPEGGDGYADGHELENVETNLAFLFKQLEIKIESNASASDLYAKFREFNVIVKAWKK